MSDLLDSLANQHLQIIDLLQKAEREGLTTAAGKETLRKGKSLVLAHLKLEDTKLYPALDANESTARLARLFSAEMKSLLTEAEALFDAIDASQDDTALARAMGRFISVLNARMRREESILYPAYKELANTVSPA